MTDHSASPPSPALLAAAPQEASWELPRDPEAVGKARDLTRDTLVGWGLAATAEDVVLIVSELVTNAVVHAAAPIELSLHVHGRAVRGEVTDRSTSTPKLVDARFDHEWGRGLALVEAYSDRWGVDPTPTGKAVWFLRSAL